MPLESPSSEPKHLTEADAAERDQVVETCAHPRQDSASLKKIEANRRNAHHSTGPRTEAGKRTASKNALKHGLLCKELVVRDRDAHETQAELNELAAQIWEECQPKGFFEERCAEEIIASYWRLRRVLRYEQGEIKRALALRRARLTRPDPFADLLSSGPLTSVELEASTADLCLPSSTDKIARYETMITKKLNRALTDLERLQSRRNEMKSSAGQNIQ